MNISVITLFPSLYEPFLAASLLARAQEEGKVSFDVASLFSHSAPKERIDGPTFGHGAGMLLRPDIVDQAIVHAEQKHGKAVKVFFSPQGKRLDQDLLRVLYAKVQETGHLMLLPARYEGMDARVEEHYADMLVSIGDLVLMGGDLPAMVLLEGLLRLIPGVVGRQESVEQDSFSGAFVDYPEYTAPVVWRGYEVPDVVRSGNHRSLYEWRLDRAAKKTVQQHFAWLRSHAVEATDRRRAEKFIPSHYVALMHTQVVLPGDRVGDSSVTSLDLHDIARSARTYGLGGYFIVTPLKDQQKMVQKLLEFWKTGVGISYNPHRHEAVMNVDLVAQLDEVIEAIEKREGKTPVVIATSAQKSEHARSITYYDQEIVWKADRPVLFVLGTGKGLAPEVIQRCDFILLPIEGFSTYNHLSVRSAAAIIFDRWLGINLKES